MEKGLVFDVTPKKEMYGPGKGYNVFAGKVSNLALRRGGTLRGWLGGRNVSGGMITAT